MSLESDLADIFSDNDWTWSTSEGSRVPREEDFELALDAAAKELYNEDVGTQLEVGRLIIKKKHQGHDVYVFAGTYQ